MLAIVSFLLARLNVVAISFAAPILKHRLFIFQPSCRTWTNWYSMTVQNPTIPSKPTLSVRREKRRPSTRPTVAVLTRCRCNLFYFVADDEAIVIGNPFQSGLTIWGQGQSQPNLSTFQMLPSWVSYVRLDWKVIASYKHSSLFGPVISDKGKKFYNTDTRCRCDSTFFVADKK